MNETCHIALLALIASGMAAQDSNPAPAAAAHSESPQLTAILERLVRLEEQNRALTDEIHGLRGEISRLRGTDSAAPAGGVGQAPLDERVAVQESRTEELAQSKVESSQKLPVSLTGMVLFNAFWNTRESGDQQYPLLASRSTSAANAGGTLRQTVIGLKFNGPTVVNGGKVSATLYMDLFAGSSSSLNHLMRLRTGSVQVDWRNTTLLAGQEKPLISLREPDSLAQVGVSPLTGAGNPWLWQPQVRLERRIGLGDSSGIRAQAALYQTAESSVTTDPEYAARVASARPGGEARLEYWRSFGERGRIELAPGFHTSQTHVGGWSVPSRVASFDWMIQPAARFSFTGLVFHGENVAVLGALRQGITFRRERPIAVRTWGGWGQLSYRPTARLTFNTYGGTQDDFNRDLSLGDTARNRVLAINAIYRFGTNILAGVEAATIRSTFLGASTRVTNHYDLAVAYLF